LSSLDSPRRILRMLGLARLEIFQTTASTNNLTHDRGPSTESLSSGQALTGNADSFNQSFISMYRRGASVIVIVMLGSCYSLCDAPTTHSRIGSDRQNTWAFLQLAIRSENEGACTHIGSSPSCHFVHPAPNNEPPQGGSPATLGERFFGSLRGTGSPPSRAITRHRSRIRCRLVASARAAIQVQRSRVAED
jgi:hypothetical protein